MYTGNSLDCVKIEQNFTVYPCAYRELQIMLPCMLVIIGLSLCIQGTLVLIVIITSNFRFIPVHTGNSLHVTGADTVLPVYPCAYRELQIDTQLILRYIGLSLCIQGTHSHCLTKYNHLRFIPVHTGNSNKSWL